MSRIRDELQEEYEDVDLLFMSQEEYDAAIIGVIDGKAHEPAVAYDFDKVIDINMAMDMTYEEAIEWWGTIRWMPM